MRPPKAWHISSFTRAEHLGEAERVVDLYDQIVRRCCGELAALVPVAARHHVRKSTAAPTRQIRYDLWISKQQKIVAKQSAVRICGARAVAFLRNSFVTAVSF